MSPVPPFSASRSGARRRPSRGIALLMFGVTSVAPALPALAEPERQATTELSPETKRAGEDAVRRGADALRPGRVRRGHGQLQGRLRALGRPPAAVQHRAGVPAQGRLPARARDLSALPPSGRGFPPKGRRRGADAQARPAMRDTRARPGRGLGPGGDPLRSGRPRPAAGAHRLARGPRPAGRGARPRRGGRGARPLESQSLPALGRRGRAALARRPRRREGRPMGGQAGPDDRLLQSIHRADRAVLGLGIAAAACLVGAAVAPQLGSGEVRASSKEISFAWRLPWQ